MSTEPQQQYDEMEIRDELDLMGVSIVEPETNKEFLQAEAFETFSTFVLEDNSEECLAILEEPGDDTVGALAGGSEEYSIYRASITGKDDDSSAVSRLLHLFHVAQPRYARVLTVPKLERYMLNMCEKRHTKCQGLGNLMLILAFGPTNGQVMHIDHMDPNLMVCCFMSKSCPTTIVYQMMDDEGGPITNACQLVEYWQQQQQQDEVAPQLVQDILLEHGDIPLSDSVATKHFTFWNTINHTLCNFGKLYLKVETPLALQGVDPGTTMIAGPVNQVHAGPPTTGPRMFAFAIGIPETDDDDDDEEEENNGEIQYSAVLLHVDLSCILFGIMEYDYTHRLEEYDAAKRFLLQILVTLCEDLPLDYFERQLGDDRAQVRDWLGKMVQRQANNNEEQIDALLQDAIEDETMFYSPHVIKLRSKKKRRVKTRKK